MDTLIPYRFSIFIVTFLLFVFFLLGPLNEFQLLGINSGEKRPIEMKMCTWYQVYMNRKRN